MRTMMAEAAMSLGLLALAGAPVSAHHSFAAEFDATRPITLQGTLTKIERLNPHGWIYVDVKGQDGKVQNWAVETGAATQLARLGLGGQVVIGSEIIVKGYRAKDGSTTMNGNTITFADGRNINLGSSYQPAPQPAAR